MRRLLASAALAAAVVGAVVVAPTASADLDPHWPIPGIGFCPGGSGGGGFIFGGSYCEGINFPDGTRWQNVRSSFSNTTACIIFTGAPLPPLAPPEGCGRG